MLDALRDVADEAGERPRRRRNRGVPHQDAEAIGVGLDVVEQREGCLLQQYAGAVSGQGTLDAVEQGPHLAVDDDRVQALLAAEVLVDDGLGDPGLGGDLLDRGGLETLLREQRAAHLQQLLPASGTRQPSTSGFRLGGGHAGQATRTRAAVGSVGRPCAAH